MSSGHIKGLATSCPRGLLAGGSPQLPTPTGLPGPNPSQGQRPGQQNHSRGEVHLPTLPQT